MSDRNGGLQIDTKSSKNGAHDESMRTLLLITIEIPPSSRGMKVMPPTAISRRRSDVGAAGKSARTV